VADKVKLGKSVVDSIWYKPEDSVWDEVINLFGFWAWSSIEEGVQEPLRDLVEASVWTPIRENLRI